MSEKNIIACNYSRLIKNIVSSIDHFAEMLREEGIDAKSVLETNRDRIIKTIDKTIEEQ